MRFGIIEYERLGLQVRYKLLNTLTELLVFVTDIYIHIILGK